MNELVPRRVLLIGMMGSGKSTVGRELAAVTGWPFLDNDELLERRTGRTARDLRNAGVDALRDGEAAALHEGIAQPPPVIIGVAAGIVLREADVAAARDGGTVVWLRAAPATLARRVLADTRVGVGTHRPWIDAGPDAAVAWLTTASAERSPVYEAVATIVVDVDRPDGTDRLPRDIATDIVERVRARDGD